MTLFDRLASFVDALLSTFAAKPAARAAHEAMGLDFGYRVNP